MARTRSVERATRSSDKNSNGIDGGMTTPAGCSFMVKSRACKNFRYADLEAADDDYHSRHPLNYEPTDDCTIFIMPMRMPNEGDSMQQLREVLQDEAVCLDTQQRLWRLRIDVATILTKLVQLNFQIVSCCVDGDVYTWTLVGKDSSGVSAGRDGKSYAEIFADANNASPGRETVRGSHISEKKIVESREKRPFEPTAAEKTGFDTRTPVNSSVSGQRETAGKTDKNSSPTDAKRGKWNSNKPTSAVEATSVFPVDDENDASRDDEDIDDFGNSADDTDNIPFTRTNGIARNNLDDDDDDEAHSVVPSEGSLPPPSRYAPKPISVRDEVGETMLEQKRAFLKECTRLPSFPAPLHYVREKNGYLYIGEPPFQRRIAMYKFQKIKRFCLLMNREPRFKLFIRRILYATIHEHEACKMSVSRAQSLDKANAQTFRVLPQEYTTAICDLCAAAWSELQYLSTTTMKPLVVSKEWRLLPKPPPMNSVRATVSGHFTEIRVEVNERPAGTRQRAKTQSIVDILPSDDENDVAEQNHAGEPDDAESKPSPVAPADNDFDDLGLDAENEAADDAEDVEFAGDDDAVEFAPNEKTRSTKKARRTSPTSDEEEEEKFQPNAKRAVLARQNQKENEFGKDWNKSVRELDGYVYVGVEPFVRRIAVDTLTLIERQVITGAGVKAPRWPHFIRRVMYAMFSDQEALQYTVSQCNTQKETTKRLDGEVSTMLPQDFINGVSQLVERCWEKLRQRTGGKVENEQFAPSHAQCRDWIRNYLVDVRRTERSKYAGGPGRQRTKYKDVLTSMAMAARDDADVSQPSVNKSGVEPYHHPDIDAATDFVPALDENDEENQIVFGGDEDDANDTANGATGAESDVDVIGGATEEKCRELFKMFGGVIPEEVEGALPSPSEEAEKVRLRVILKNECVYMGKPPFQYGVTNTRLASIKQMCFMKKTPRFGAFVSRLVRAAVPATIMAQYSTVERVSISILEYVPFITADAETTTVGGSAYNTQEARANLKVVPQAFFNSVDDILNAVWYELRTIVYRERKDNFDNAWCKALDEEAPVPPTREQVRKWMYSAFSNVRGQFRQAALQKKNLMMSMEKRRKRQDGSPASRSDISPSGGHNGADIDAESEADRNLSAEFTERHYIPDDVDYSSCTDVREIIGFGANPAEAMPHFVKLQNGYLILGSPSEARRLSLIKFQVCKKYTLLDIRKPPKIQLFARRILFATIRSGEARAMWMNDKKTSDKLSGWQQRQARKQFPRTMVNALEELTYAAYVTVQRLTETYKHNKIAWLWCQKAAEIQGAPGTSLIKQWIRCYLEDLRRDEAEEQKLGPRVRKRRLPNGLIELLPSDNEEEEAGGGDIADEKFDNSENSLQRSSPNKTTKPNAPQSKKKPAALKKAKRSLEDDDEDDEDDADDDDDADGDYRP